jgi:hypothetical protein
MGDYRDFTVHARHSDPMMGDNEWRTSDMYLAAFLLAVGAKMIRHIKSGSDRSKSKIWFVFEKTDNLEKLQQEYHVGSARVVALDFVMRIKAIKSLIHS